MSTLNDSLAWPLRLLCLVALIASVYSRGRLDSSRWWLRHTEKSVEMYEASMKRSLALNFSQNAWIMKHMADEHMNWQGPIQ